MKLNSLFSLAAVTLETPGTDAQAAVDFLSLAYVIAEPSPARRMPAINVRCEDGRSANTVRLTVDVTPIDASALMSGWYLNLNPRINPASLSFRLVQDPAQPVLSDRAPGASPLTADQGGFYDLYRDFPPPPGTFSAKFAAEEKIIVDAYRSDGLAPSDFLFPSLSQAPSSVSTRGSAVILALFLHRRIRVGIPSHS